MYWHATIASVGRVTVFPNEVPRRAAVRALARVGGEALLLFGVVDDHVHLVLSAERDAAAARVGAISRALRAVGATPLQRAHIAPVETRAHLSSLVGYIARQPRKHGIDAHPAAWSGTCAPDLLGTRAVAGFDRTRIARALPRVNVLQLVAQACDVPPAHLLVATDDEVRELGPADLWTTVCAAAALDPANADRAAATVAARIAWARLCQVRPAAATDAGGVALRTFHRWRSAEGDPAFEEAVRRRVALDRWLGVLDAQRHASAHAPPR